MRGERGRLVGWGKQLGHKERELFPPAAFHFCDTPLFLFCFVLFFSFSFLNWFISPERSLEFGWFSERHPPSSAYLRVCKCVKFCMGENAAAMEQPPEISMRLTLPLSAVVTDSVLKNSARSGLLL